MEKKDVDLQKNIYTSVYMYICTHNAISKGYGRGAVHSDDRRTLYTSLCWPAKQRSVLQLLSKLLTFLKDTSHFPVAYHQARRRQKWISSQTVWYWWLEKIQITVYRIVWLIVLDITAPFGWRHSQYRMFEDAEKRRLYKKTCNYLGI